MLKTDQRFQIETSPFIYMIHHFQVKDHTLHFSRVVDISPAFFSVFPQTVGWVGKDSKYLFEKLFGKQSFSEIECSLCKQCIPAFPVLAVTSDRRWYHIHAKLLDSSSLVTYFEDVSVLMQQQEQILLEKHHLSMIANHSEDAILLVQVNQGVFTYLEANVQAAKDVGLSPNDIIGKTPAELLGDDLGEQIESYFLKCTQDKSTQLFEVSITIDGNINYFETKISPIEDEGIVNYLVVNSRNITNQHKMKHRLISAEERLHHVMNLTSVGMWSYDFSSQSMSISDDGFLMLGYLREELEPISMKTWHHILHPEDYRIVMDAYIVMRKNHTYKLDTTIRLRHQDGLYRWILIRGAIISWQTSEEPKILSGVYIDVTKDKELEGKLIESEKKYRYLANHIRDVVWTCDLNLNITYISPSIEKLTGYTDSQYSLRDLSECYTKESLEVIYQLLASEIAKESLEEVDKDRSIVAEIQYIHKDGHPVWTQMNVTFVRDGEGTPIGLIGTSRDISSQKEAQDQITYMSYHDQLTGVYNLRYFNEEIHRLSYSDHFPLAIVMMDINGLKLANDAFGHETGDKLIIEVTKLVSSVIRSNDIFARIGGDEFVLLLPKRPSQIAESLIDRIHQLLSGKEVSSIPLSMSMGYTMVSERNQLAEGMRIAEENMYRQKLIDAQQIRKELLSRIENSLFQEYPHEKNHAKNVSYLSMRIAEILEINHDFAETMKLAGYYHDIGKISISTECLMKNQLSLADWLEIQRHSEIGYRILTSINEYTFIAQMILDHHERVDGSGYPKGLTGDQLSVGSKILSIANAIDAMSTDRWYRPAIDQKSLIAELIKGKDAQFDGEMVDRILSANLLEEFYKYKQKIERA